MAGKMQLLNLLLLVIMHTKGAFKKEEEEFFSPWSQAEGVESTDSIAGGVWFQLPNPQ